MPKVSIIIPTYNAEKFLDITIKSVLAQTFKEWELIIVDDFSKDNTRKIIKDWEAKDERIHSIFLDKNSGAPAHPKNVGIEIAKGAYIAYLDQDDEWLPEKLEKQVHILDNNPQVSFLSCEAFIINESGEIVDKITIPPVPKSGELFPDLFTVNFMFSNSSLMIRREVIDRCGPRDENPEIGGAEDREYELRVASAGYHFYVIHEPLFKYRMHKNNLTKTGKDTILHGANADYKYIDIYKKYNLPWLFFKRSGYAFLREGDTENARKYLDLLFSEKSPTVKERFVYLLSCLGEPGSKIFALIITALDNIKKSNHLFYRILNRKGSKS